MLYVTNLSKKKKKNVVCYNLQFQPVCQDNQHVQLNRHIVETS